MKRIITIGLILILFNQYAIAQDSNKAFSLVSQLISLRVELDSIIKALADLNLKINSDNINKLNNNASFYVNLCHCQANVLYLYLKFDKGKRKDISSYLYNDLFMMKPSFEQNKKIFLTNYSDLKNKSALQLADDIKIKINEIEILYEQVLEIYRSK